MKFGWEKNRSYKLFIGGASFVGLMLVMLGVGYLYFPYTYKGTKIDPPVVINDFTLLTQQNESFKLSSLHGTYTFIFFGYTHCPDVCPITLSEFKRIKEGLGKNADQVKFVFITVDPQRDTADVLQQHLSRFDPAFIGLSGSEDQLKLVWDAFGVYREKRDATNSDSYLVDHTARIYLLDKEGQLFMTYPYDMGWETILGDLQHILRRSN